MRMYDLIQKKKAGGELSRAEIDWMVQGYTKGEIPDYQMSAMTMAICFKGMNERETGDLTLSMRDSGDTVDLSSINGIKVDKHSTGGVGDKTSISLLPLVSSVGVKLAKMSGRGLGHTGGTIDKLEAIPGTPPNMIYPPKGDAFADRNRYAMQIDFEQQPPEFRVSDTHWAATWLLHPNAPKAEPPKAVTERIAKMKARLEEEAHA